MTSPCRPFAAPYRDLGQAGRVGVVDDVDVAPVRGEQLVGVLADPALVDVGRRAHDAVLDDAGHGHAHRPSESSNLQAAR